MNFWLHYSKVDMNMIFIFISLFYSSLVALMDFGALFLEELLLL